MKLKLKYGIDSNIFDNSLEIDVVVDAFAAKPAVASDEVGAKNHNSDFIF